MTRKNTIRKCGHIWKKSILHYDNEYSLSLGRFTIDIIKKRDYTPYLTIEYDYKVSGEPVKLKHYDGLVRLCLNPQPLLEPAIKSVLDWINKYPKSLPTPAKVFKSHFRCFPNLFKNKISVIDNIFFTLGAGNSWLDGTIVDYSPDPTKEELKRIRKEDKKTMCLINSIKILETSSAYIADHDEKLRYDNEDKVYDFYSVAEDYSLICRVPDDVKPKWLKLSYEAALLLRDNSGVPKYKSKTKIRDMDQHISNQKKNREIGAKVVKELETRFPYVKSL